MGKIVLNGKVVAESNVENVVKAQGYFGGAYKLMVTNSSNELVPLENPYESEVLVIVDENNKLTILPPREPIGFGGVLYLDQSGKPYWK